MPNQINAEIMSSLCYGLWKGIKFNCNHYYNNSSQIYMDRLKIFKSIALAAAFLLPTTYAAYKQTEHQLWSFGFNRNGELGLGSENNVSFPQPLKTLMFVDIDTKKSLSAGLTKDGELYTWGKNRNGNLGHNPPNVNVLIPRQVQFSQRIVQVSCGYQQVCAVTQKGEAFVWGLQQNKSRFRAIGTKESQQESDNKSYKKIQLANVKSVSCSKDYIALVNNEGKLFVVGDTNIKGVNNSQAKNKTELVELEIQKIVKVASGNNYSMALDEQGKVYVWGNNLNGQLGTGGLRNAYQPIFLETLASEKIVDISCGENYSGVVTQKGDVYTWGFGNEGQLGHGDRSDQFVPRKLINLKQKVKKISCGGGHTALVTEGQKVLIVGRGRQGQLGREQKDESSSGYTLLAREVTKLPQKRKIIKVECGQAHTLVLLDTLL